MYCDYCCLVTIFPQLTVLLADDASLDGSVQEPADVRRMSFAVQPPSARSSVQNDQVIPSAEQPGTRVQWSCCSQEHLQ